MNKNIKINIEEVDGKNYYELFINGKSRFSTSILEVILGEIKKEMKNESIINNS